VNNLAIFVTHSVFLAKEQLERLLSGVSVEAEGHCVPVWVDAKTGKTTEPAPEIFCLYKINSNKDQKSDLKIMTRKGYEIFLPTITDWKPPEEINYEEISGWSSKDRMDLMKERDKWWFSNPKPPMVSDLERGYMRFEVKKYQKGRIKGKRYSEQHIVEIAEWDRLFSSLTT
jgi:hypothetical protein